MAETMELAGPAPLCLENLKGQAQVGWTLTDLFQTETLKHFWEVWNDAWSAVPTGDLWVYGSHGWPTCLEIGLDIVLGDGPICLLEFRKLL